MTDTTNPAGRASKIRLTKASVRNLPVPREGLSVWWDSQLAGLGVRVTDTGRKTYFLQTRTRVGRAIKVTIGGADRITCEQAREIAARHFATIAHGGDPAADLRAARLAEKARARAETFNQLWEVYAAEYLPTKRPKTRAAYASWFNLHIRPALGRMKLPELTAQRVARLHRDVSAAAGRSTGNRVIAALSSMLTFAVRHQLVPGNVARGAVEWNREAPRERNLTDAELRALLGHLAALTASPASPMEARVVAFLIATSARHGEVRALRWGDLDSGWWTVPAGVSKSGKPVRRPLNEAALAIIGDRQLGVAPHDLVFRGVSEARLAKWWRQERKVLGLEDVHLHDLRHAVASQLLNAGIPLAAVGKMLGHGADSGAMTRRYAHLTDKSLAEASAAVAERLKLLREAPVQGTA